MGKGLTFDKYIAYIKKQFKHPVILLHGYTSPSVKDATHHNRSNGVVGLGNLYCYLTIAIQKDLFLPNRQNKHNFMNPLSRKLQENDIKILNADGDADL